MFCMQHSLVESNLLYIIMDKLLGDHVRRDEMPAGKEIASIAVPKTTPDSDGNNAKRPVERPFIQMAELNETREAMARQVEFDRITIICESFEQGLVMIFAIENLKSHTDMKRL